MQPIAEKPKQFARSSVGRQNVMTLIDPCEMLVTPIEAEGFSLEWLVDRARQTEGRTT